MQMQMQMQQMQMQMQQMQMLMQLNRKQQVWPWHSYDQHRACRPGRALKFLLCLSLEPGWRLSLNAAAI